MTPRRGHSESRPSGSPQNSRLFIGLDQVATLFLGNHGDEARPLIGPELPRAAAIEPVQARAAWPGTRREARDRPRDRGASRHRSGPAWRPRTRRRPPSARSPIVWRMRSISATRCQVVFAPHAGMGTRPAAAALIEQDDAPVCGIEITPHRGRNTRLRARHGAPRPAAPSGLPHCSTLKLMAVAHVPACADFGNGSIRRKQMPPLRAFGPENLSICILYRPPRAGHTAQHSQEAGEMSNETPRPNGPRKPSMPPRSPSSKAMAAEWWDPNGKFKPLHMLTPCRLDYITSQIAAEFGRGPEDGQALRGPADPRYRLRRAGSWRNRWHVWAPMWSAPMPPNATSPWPGSMPNSRA